MSSQLQGLLLQVGIWFLLSKESVWTPKLLDNQAPSTSLTQATCGREAGSCRCDKKPLVSITAHDSSCLAAALQPLWIPATSSNFPNPLQKIPGKDFC